MIKKLAMTFILIGIISFGTELCARAGGAKINPSNDITQALTALLKAHDEMDLEKGDELLLTLTNAGYGALKGQSTEAFLDIISEATGCTIGKRNLLMIHTPFTESLWFALFRKDNGRIVFIRWRENAFKQNEINVSPDNIMNPKAWKEAASGLIGRKNCFPLFP